MAQAAVNGASPVSNALSFVLDPEQKIRQVVLNLQQANIALTAEVANTRQEVATARQEVATTRHQLDVLVKRTNGGSSAICDQVDDGGSCSDSDDTTITGEKRLSSTTSGEGPRKKKQKQKKKNSGGTKVIVPKDCRKEIHQLWKDEAVKSGIDLSKSWGDPANKRPRESMLFAARESSYSPEQLLAALRTYYDTKKREVKDKAPKLDKDGTVIISGEQMVAEQAKKHRINAARARVISY
jgi:hypothetical protein